MLLLSVFVYNTSIIYPSYFISHLINNRLILRPPLVLLCGSYMFEISTPESYGNNSYKTFAFNTESLSA